MMNELKPEDVMRALAWYEVVGKNIGSVTVPYNEIQAIAALLRGMDAILEMGAETIERKDKEIAEKDALIEDYRQELGRTRVALNDARRDCAVSEQNHYECKKELETARAEAITEFALRLKSCEFYEVADQYDGMQYVDFCDWVDQIAKELKEETNGESDL